MNDARRRPRLAARLQGFGETVFATMSALAVAHDAVNLGQGFPDDDAPDELRAAARDAITEGRNQYAPGRGVPALRRAVADHQRRHRGMTLDPDREVAVTAGATEGIFCALQALCEVGDEVVALEPTYDSYGASATMAGARLRGVPLALVHGRFALDGDRLRATVGPRTRVLLLNTPHNPTGSVLTDEELAVVADVAIERDLVVVSDEVYEHLAFDRPHRSIAALPGMRERTLTLSSAGKSFSVTGWKVGWATGPAPLVDALVTAKQFVTFTNATPFQHALAAFLPGADDHLAAQAASLAARRDRLEAGLAAAGLAPVHAEGGYFTVADVRGIGAHDGLDLCRRMPEQVGVAAIPVQVLCEDPATARHLVRFAFCKSLATIEAGLARLTPGALARLVA